MKNPDNYLTKLLQKEILHQQNTINLIASENIMSQAVLRALATPFANKYAEGYPGRRYYGGNEVCDEVERAAQEYAKRLFRLGADWRVNVQPYSGSPANAAIYMALMNFGDALMGLKLSDGGHLTHGHSVTFSGKAYRSVHYIVDPKTGIIDYENLYLLAKKHKPKVIVSGFSAYPRKVNFRAFGLVAKKVGAYHVADISHIAGLVAAGLHPSPFPHADAVMTTTHKTLRGPRGAVIFARKKIADAIDRAVFPGLQGGPHMNVIYAKAVAFNEALKPEFKKYQKQIIKNAKIFAEELRRRNFILISGGTDTHLIVVDCHNLGIDGYEAQRKLEAIGIITNRNSIPGDVSPSHPSGIRFGVPAVTARGFKEREIIKIAEAVDMTLNKKDCVDGRKIMDKLCKNFPLCKNLPFY